MATMTSNPTSNAHMMIWAHSGTPRREIAFEVSVMTLSCEHGSDHGRCHPSIPLLQFFFQPRHVIIRCCLWRGGGPGRFHCGFCPESHGAQEQKGARQNDCRRKKVDQRVESCLWRLSQDAHAILLDKILFDLIFAP